VLDAHGVVLGNPLPGFLRDLARETGQAHDAFKRRWKEGLRRDAWLGREEDERLWIRITTGIGDPLEWRRRLEERYDAGPAAPHLDRWHRHASLWMLSNHRSAWLHPRLARFGLDGVFERILVSDRIGAVKPEPEAFRAALEGLESPELALVVDDRKRNIRAARALGIPAVRVAVADPGWVDEVDAWLDQAGSRTTCAGRAAN
jgi:putative hydrolase of the HAD superfamily